MGAWVPPPGPGGPAKSIRDSHRSCRPCPQRVWDGQLWPTVCLVQEGSMGRGPGSEQGQGRVCGQGLEIQEGSGWGLKGSR